MDCGLDFGSASFRAYNAYFLGISVKDYITAFDHWIALGLLFLGGKMIKEALSHDEIPSDTSLSCKNMLLFAIVTSIDAMAVGVLSHFLMYRLFLLFALSASLLLHFRLLE